MLGEDSCIEYAGGADGVVIWCYWAGGNKARVGGDREAEGAVLGVGQYGAAMALFVCIVGSSGGSLVCFSECRDEGDEYGALLVWVRGLVVKDDEGCSCPFDFLVCHRLLVCEGFMGAAGMHVFGISRVL